MLSVVIVVHCIDAADCIKLSVYLHEPPATLPTRLIRIRISVLLSHCRVQFYISLWLSHTHTQIKLTYFSIAFGHVTENNCLLFWMVDFLLVICLKLIFQLFEINTFTIFGEKCIVRCIALQKGYHLRSFAWRQQVNSIHTIRLRYVYLIRYDTPDKWGEKKTTADEWHNMM